MSEESVQSLKMLYCYASEDQRQTKEIDFHLSDLKRQCHIISRFDGELFPHPKQKEKLLALLPETDLVLLLVSSHFQKVAAFWDEISHEAWAVRWLGGCRVVALVLEPVNWNNAPYASREILPRNSTVSMEWREPEPVDPIIEVFSDDIKPLTEWQSQEQAFQSIKRGMRVTIERQWLARGDYLGFETGGGSEEALAAYNEALRLNPSVKYTWYGKAYVLNGLNRHEEALSACDEALRLDPDYPWVWYTKGNAFAGLKRYEEALHAYNEALRLEPAGYWFWHEKGEVLKALGRRKEARQMQKKARQLGWRA